ESEKTRMYAEARFLRAFYYSELVRRFGGIIILDHSIDANDYSALTNQPRETFENSVEWVCNELTEAARDLPPVCSASDVG
ncbi:UNVERIFIED_CONTAM: RagB/SusD family nutrient uptake outer membrane protein, partial [Prevotella sp. 15_C9]